MFDGFPRTRSRRACWTKSSRAMAGGSSTVFLLDVPREILVDRLSGRRVCKNCGAVYHVRNIPSKVAGVCDQCEGPLYQRPDDTEATVLNRLEVFQKQTRSLIDYYEQKKVLFRIDAGKKKENHAGRDCVHAEGPDSLVMILIKTPTTWPACGSAAGWRPRCLDAVAEGRPGVTTGELDVFAAELMRAGREKRVLWISGLSRHICVSVNEEVVHGIPGPRRVQIGDIVSLDVGVVSDGFVGDTATTVMVGVNDPKVVRLVTRAEGFGRGDRQAVAGARLSDISHAIETVATERVFGGAGFCGAWRRPKHARGSADSQFRAAGKGPEAEAWHDLGAGADDQHGGVRGGGHGGRLDGDDAGPAAVGPFRAHGGGRGEGRPKS